MSGETFGAMLAPNLRAVRKTPGLRLRTADDADDVFQKILLRAYKYRNQLRSEAKFRTWIWSIALNEIRAFFRRNRITPGIADIPDLEARDQAVSALAQLEQRKACDWILACISELSERDQIAIRLVDLEGMSLRDAASVLHNSVGAARLTHFRAGRRSDHIVRRRAFRQSRQHQVAA